MKNCKWVQQTKSGWICKISDHINIYKTVGEDRVYGHIQILGEKGHQIRSLWTVQHSQDGKDFDHLILIELKKAKAYLEKISSHYAMLNEKVKNYLEQIRKNEEYETL